MQSFKHCILSKSRMLVKTTKMCLERSNLGTVKSYEMTCVRNRQPVVDSYKWRHAGGVNFHIKELVKEQPTALHLSRSSMVSTSALTVSTSRAAPVQTLLLQARFLQRLVSLPNVWLFRVLRNVLSKLLENPHVAELLRFIFLGTIVETSRLAGQKVVDFAKHCRSSDD